MPIRLVIDFDHALTRRDADAARIKRHISDGVIVGESVEDGAGAEIPDLSEFSSANHPTQSATQQQQTHPKG